MTKWHGPFTACGFSSRTSEGDEEGSTGKWLVKAPKGDPEGLVDRIVIAAASGRLPCVKSSTDRLEAELGHALACVYSPSSRIEDVTAILSALRELGVTEDLEYKTDLATSQERDDAFWTARGMEVARAPFPAAYLP